MISFYVNAIWSLVLASFLNCFNKTADTLFNFEIDYEFEIIS